MYMRKTIVGQKDVRCEHIICHLKTRVMNHIHCDKTSFKLYIENYSNYFIIFAYKTQRDIISNINNNFMNNSILYECLIRTFLFHIVKTKMFTN